MSQDENQNCLHCKFWHSYPGPTKRGECRRRAPKTNDLHDTLFPPMLAGGWCGGFIHGGDRAQRLLNFQPGPDTSVERVKSEGS